MGEIKIVLPNDEEQKFRRLAMERYGYIKGAISEAAREAIRKWANFKERELTKEDFWDSLEGVMKHVKKTSVQLQHEAWDYIAKKHTAKRKK